MTRDFDIIYQGVIYSKKNSKQIVKDATGRPRIISNAKAREMEHDMIQQFHSQMPLIGLEHQIYMTQTERILACKDHARTYTIEATIWNPNNIRRDLDNQITSLLDGMVQAGVLPDDCSTIVTSIRATFGGVDRINPRAEIHITEASE